MLGSPLLNKNFNLLFISQLVSQTGSAIFRIGMVTWLVEEMNSPERVAWFYTAVSLPFLLFGPIGGSIVDRLSRKRVIVYSDFFIGIVVLLMLVPINWLDNIHVAFPLILVTAAMCSVADMLNRCALMASVPNIVPFTQVTSATSLLQSCMQASVVIGRSFAGVLLSVLGAPLLIMINGLSYLFAASTERFITMPQTKPIATNYFQGYMHSFIRDMVEGFSYVIGDSGLRILFLVMAIYTYFVAPIVVVMPFFVENTLNASLTWYGPLLGGMALGTVAGSLVAGAIRISPKHRSKIVLVAVACTFISFIGVSCTTHMLSVFVLIFLSGSFGGLTGVLVIATIQHTCADHIRGRVTSLYTTIAALFSTLSMVTSATVTGIFDNDMAQFLLFYGVLGAFICLPLLVFYSKDICLLMAFE